MLNRSQLKYQDGLLRFEHKAAKENVRQRHFFNSFGSNSQILSSLMTFGAALPASTNTFFSLR